LSLEDGTDTLSRNVGNKRPIYAVQTSFTPRWKHEITQENGFTQGVKLENDGTDTDVRIT
jgi:hypothetical protein